jgi:hypothetical protein
MNRAKLIGYALAALAAVSVFVAYVLSNGGTDSLQIALATLTAQPVIGDITLTVVTPSPTFTNTPLATVTHAPLITNTPLVNPTPTKVPSLTPVNSVTPGNTFLTPTPDSLTATPYFIATQLGIDQKDCFFNGACYSGVKEQYIVTAVPSLNIRRGANLSGQIVGALRTGQKVFIRCALDLHNGQIWMSETGCNDPALFNWMAYTLDNLQTTFLKLDPNQP